MAGRRSVAWLAVAIAATGGALSLGGAAAFNRAEHRAADAAIDKRTAAVRTAVAGQISRYLDTVRAIAAAAGTVPRLDAGSFAAVTAHLETADLPGTGGVEFAVRVPTAEVPAAQAHWRELGSSDLVLRPEGPGDTHVFPVLHRQLAYSAAPALGRDVTQTAEVSAALSEARRTGTVAVSDTYPPPGAAGPGLFALVAPVYGGTGPGRVLRGWVLLDLQAHAFLAWTMDPTAQGLIDVTLVADQGDGRPVPVATAVARGGRPGPTDRHRTTEVAVAQKRWTLTVSAARASLPGGDMAADTAMSVGGPAISILLALLIHSLVTARARAAAEVARATGDLRRAEAESRRQNALLAAVMNSISDGVGVVDEQGEFLLHNPAAKRMLGIEKDISGPDRWQQHYGIFRPDGTTPYPVEELPLVRALGGESTDNAEMVIRNAGRPEGIRLSVSGRPLDPAAGQPGAVAVFHDVTAQREHEAELAAFAGIVAHDLKSPLATVIGFAELLADELEALDAPDADRATAGSLLGRVRDGTERMRRLIDDLLAYVMSRDAAPSLARVDLRAVACASADGHVARLAQAGGGPAGGGPVLEIYVGHLPDARADAGMVRQLFDNLVANAFTYTPPGQPVRIDITGRAEPDGWVRVEVADRGIGIPAGQHAAIFRPFHRARGSVGPVGGPAGPGLGLATCKRIVERHGGTIQAIDNDGGGARIAFTLPAAQRGSADAAPATGPHRRVSRGDNPH